MSNDSVSLSSRIRSWIEEAAGGRIEYADRRPGGARREAWVIDVRKPDGALEDLFLRYDRSDPKKTGDPYTLHREATIYLALAGTDVPIPRVVGVHPEEQAILSHRIPGETWFSRIRDESEALSVARDFITKLVALHRLDPKSLRLPAFPPVTRVPDHVGQELDVWENLYRTRAPAAEPMIEFSLKWLRRNVPDYETPVVLVQGDTGPGNFLYQNGRVTAVLDWELAHLGDPMDDVAWLSLRAVQEPFTHLPDRLKEYEQLSGHRLDARRIRFYRLFAELRIAIMGQRPRGAVDPLGEVGAGLIYGALHRRLLVEAQADACGMSFQEPIRLPEVTPKSHDFLYDAALAQLREIIVPRIQDPLAALRAKGLARILKQLRAIDRWGALFAEQEREELSDLLGRRVASVAEARVELAQAVRRGEVADEAFLRHMTRRVARDTEATREAMGVLADRHYAPLG